MAIQMSPDGSMALYADHSDENSQPGFEFHEWTVDLNSRHALNKRGIVNPRMYDKNWLKVSCNNTDCPAWGYINPAEAFKNVFPEAPEGSSPDGDIADKPEYVLEDYIAVASEALTRARSLLDGGRDVDTA